MEFINYKELPEMWRPVPKMEDRFEISSHGRLRNKNTLNIRSPQTSGSGYMYFMLYDPTTKTRRKKYLHRMIAQQFVPNPYKFHEVNHIDGNKHNNNIENLEWVNTALNAQHAVNMGLTIPYFTKENAGGEKNMNAKLTWDIVREIRDWYSAQERSGEELKEIAEQYGVAPKTIYGIVKGYSWKED